MLTYAPGLSKKTDEAILIAVNAMQRWPLAPAASLRAHLSALRITFASCPAVSRRSDWGRGHETHMENVARAIALLDAK